MDWFVDLYDEFRMRTGFGRVPDEETQKDVNFICDVLELHEGAKVLDLFCGAGRHSLELARRGYSATGIELNPDYLELGKKSGKVIANAPKFIQGDVRYVDFGEGYDAALVMFQSFGYFSDSEDKSVLSKVFDALKIKGRFLIEILNRDWILKNFVEIQEDVIDGIRVIEKREFDVLTSRNNFVIQRHEEDGIVTKRGSWRLYSAHEMKKILKGIGFRFVGGYSNLEKEPLTKDTRLMRMVFEK
jgi:SAM-dependent methyltransferase